MIATKQRPPRVSSWVKGASGLMITAFVDMMVAFSTAYWATWTSKDDLQHGGYGLWKMWECGLSERETRDHVVSKQGLGCEERMAGWLNFPGWMLATQVMETMGLIGITASLVLLFLYILHPKWEKNKTAMSTLVAISYLSGLFILVGLCIFGYFIICEMPKQANYVLSWSFSLACTAFVLNEVGASILVTETKRLYEEDRRRRQQPAHPEELQSIFTYKM